MLRVIAAVLTFHLLAGADCLPITQAREHIGEDRCVSGKLLHVKRGARGVLFFDFCEDFRVCPFTVVIFPGKLKDIGDVHALENRVIEVHGTLKSYDGRAEIVLNESRQLGGESAFLPKLPKNYDVEQRGRYSAGSAALPRQKRTTTKKRQDPTLPLDVPADDE